MTDVYAPQSSDDAKKFVKSFGDDGTAEFDQVNFEDLDFSRIFGQTTTSNTSNAIEYGVKGFTLDYDNNSIQVGYPLQCRSLDDPDCFMQGVVVLKDQTYSPAYIEVAITVISPLVNTSFNWELSVIPLAGFSINPSATVGISTTSIDASGAGPFTFTTQTVKLFMQNVSIGGSVVCASLADPKTYLHGRIAAINGTSLVLNKIYSNALAAVSAWSIQLFDGPAKTPAYFSQNGLAVTQDSADTLLFHIQPGSVVDSTQTLTLTTDTVFTKRMDAVFAVGAGQGGMLRSAALAGTISNAGTSITGTGTAFLTDFDNLSMTDYTTSLGTISNDKPIISVAADAAGTLTITDNTNLTTHSAVTSAGSAYFRGGAIASLATESFLVFVCMMRRDSDGAIDFGFTCATPTGQPDLPSGYTFYRVIAKIFNTVGTVEIFQPIAEVTYPFAPDQAQYVLLQAYDEDALPNHWALGNSTSILKNVAGGPPAMTLQRAALTGDVTAPQNSNATTLSSTAITNKTEKTTLVDDDLFLIADSEASFALKKVKNVNAGGGGSGSSFPADMGLITEAATISFDAGTVP